MPRTITAGFPHRRQWCMIASVADTKSDLRARIRAARQQGAGAADRAHEPAGLLAAARAAGLLDPGGKPEVGAVAIAAYIAAPGEPDVAGIRAAVRQAGGVVLLPIPRADRTMDWAHDDGDYRPEGRYPIEVPAGAVVGSGAAGLLAHGVRTVLVPALAVDATGVRLGQGGGYYDRLLSELATLAALTRSGGGPDATHPAAADVRLIAVVRDVELLLAGCVPREAHDQLMTAALTPTRFVALDR
jgi:5-formyltetrahydrofolate cyclo-ligase